jgi:Zn-dependent protease with chaperone function
MKLLFVVLEGWIYLAGFIAIFVAELAFLLWGLWSRRPIIGLIAVFVTVPLIRTTFSAIRACFFKIPAPEGLPLARSDGSALYDLVEDIQRAVDAPAIDGIVITSGFNASATVHSPRLGRRHRTLVLGLPMLTTLSTAELRAVIAHELAHFSHASDPFAAWVYRTRRSWLALRVSLDHRLATPVYVYWLLRWYVPRLNAVSGEVARRHEFTADRVAASVAGNRATADALVAVEAGTRFAEDVHWPAIQISHETAAEPPRPYSGMLTWNARTISSQTLDEIFEGAAGIGDTHPSLGERFSRLEESPRLPPPIDRSAGEEILGAGLQRVADALDRRWMDRNGQSWQEHRAEYLDRTLTLDRLSSIEAPTPDERFKRAELVEILQGADQALPIYQSAAADGHACASLAAGRLLLDRTDPSGVAMVEDAMARDSNLTPAACRMLAEYYRATNQELAARKCEWRANRHTTSARLAQAGQTRSLLPGF